MMISLNPDPSCDDYVDPIPFLKNPEDPSMQREPSYYDLSIETPEASTPIHSTPIECNTKSLNQSTEDLKDITSNVPKDAAPNPEPSSEFFELYSPESDLLLPSPTSNRTSLAIMIDNMFSDFLLKNGQY